MVCIKMLGAQAVDTVISSALVAMLLPSSLSSLPAYPPQNYTERCEESPQHSWCGKMSCGLIFHGGFSLLHQGFSDLLSTMPHSRCLLILTTATYCLPKEIKNLKNELHSLHLPPFFHSGRRRLKWERRKIMLRSDDMVKLGPRKSSTSHAKPPPVTNAEGSKYGAQSCNTDYAGTASEVGLPSLL